MQNPLPPTLMSCRATKKILFEVSDQGTTIFEAYGICEECHDVFSAESLHPFVNSLEVFGSRCKQCLNLEDHNVTVELALQSEHLF